MIRKRGLAAVALAVALLAGACSSDEGDDPLDPEEKAKAKPAAECLASSKIPPGVDAKRPAVAIKVENDPAARPLAGLEDAVNPRAPIAELCDYDFMLKT